MIDRLSGDPALYFLYFPTPLGVDATNFQPF